MANETKQEIAVSEKPRTVVAEPVHPATTLAGAMEEVEHLFDRLMPRGWMFPMNWNWPMWQGFEESVENIRVPKIDVLDRDVEVLVRAEIPGVDKKNVEVSVMNSTLQIKGRVQKEAREVHGGFYRCEISQGSFSRKISLPAGIDKSKISASVKDGSLEITLPKLPEARRQSIEIR